MCVEVVDDVGLILKALRLFQVVQQFFNVDLAPFLKCVPMHDGSATWGVVRGVRQFKVGVIHCPQMQKLWRLCRQ